MPRQSLGVSNLPYQLHARPISPLPLFLRQLLIRLLLGMPRACRAGADLSPRGLGAGLLETPGRQKAPASRDNFEPIREEQVQVENINGAVAI